MKIVSSLTNDIHFMIAMLQEMPVSVWMQNELLEPGGTIEEISDNAVIINGEEYLKTVCNFIAL